MFSSEHLYSIALRRCSIVGDINFHRLVKIFGSAEKVWNFPKKEFKDFGVKGRIIQDIGNEQHLEFAENELKFCEKNHIQIFLRHQNQLPGLLSECVDAPAILYAKGSFPTNTQPVSMVGTRNITAYGKHFIADFLQSIKGKNCATISGLAYGVDAEVHQQSIEGQIPTVAVLAHGLHMLYPSKHKKLSEKIIENGGALISEFDSSRKPNRENFIQRNRIIAGISPSTIVVETAFGGGSVSTVGFANGYNRDVYALPGKITEKYSQGCNHLIYQNKATVISTIRNLVEDLGLVKHQSPMVELFPVEPVVALTEFQQKIFFEIQKNPGIFLDNISENLDIPGFKILPEILNLELLGKVKSNSGRQFYLS